MKRAKRINHNRSIKYLTVLFLSVSLLGCSSIDVEKVRALDKVAVPMITVDKYIDMGKFNLSSAIQRLAEDEKFDLQPALDNLHDKTYNDFATSLPFSMVDEKKLLESEAYKNFDPYSESKSKSLFANIEYLLNPKGYNTYGPVIVQTLTKKMNKQRAKILEVIPEEADAAMFVYVDYELVKRDIPMVPMSNAAIKAKVNIDVFNKKNEKVLKIRKSAESDEDIKAVAGVMTDTDKIRSMTLNATNKALQEADNFIKENL